MRAIICSNWILISKKKGLKKLNVLVDIKILIFVADLCLLEPEFFTFLFFLSQTMCNVHLLNWDILDKVRNNVESSVYPWGQSYTLVMIVNFWGWLTEMGLCVHWKGFSYSTPWLLKKYKYIRWVWNSHVYMGYVPESICGQRGTLSSGGAVQAWGNGTLFWFCPKKPGLWPFPFISFSHIVGSHLRHVLHHKFRLDKTCFVRPSPNSPSGWRDLARARAAELMWVWSGQRATQTPVGEH